MNANERKSDFPFFIRVQSRSFAAKFYRGPYKSSLTPETLASPHGPVGAYARGMAFEVRHFSPLI